MNRIILIGNGFDLAHGLKTSYRDFIDDFWKEKIDEIALSTIKKEEAHLIRMIEEWADKCENIDTNQKVRNLIDKLKTLLKENEFFKIEGGIIAGGGETYRDIKYDLETGDSNLIFKNSFLKQISEQLGLENWVDIENEYFKSLKECFGRKEGIKLLNKDFGLIRQALIDYLITTTTAAKPAMKTETYNKIHSNIDFPSDFNRKYLYEIAEANCKSQPFYQMLERRNYIENKKKELINNKMKAMITRKDEFPNELLFLSLNYTDTETLYTKELKDVKAHFQTIHIHGELGNPDNPIIFGFGDENCKDYKEIEDLNNNDYLEYFKTTMYSNTSNYRDFLNFIDTDKYQVFIMGASCGASDKTLLKTMFEHENCMSIKCFYHKKDDGTDDYSNIIKNISRCFSDKAMMRAKVVNKELCKPLKDT
jgi:hypothetical protein